MFTKRISIGAAAAAAALMFGAAGAQAQQTAGAYAGAAAGKTRFTLGDCSGECSETETGGKAYGGYKFANGWALEGTYFRFGRMTGSGSFGSAPFTATLTADGLGAGGAYFFDFGSPFNAVMRAGLSANKLKARATGSLSGSDSETKVKPYIGLGVGYAVTKKVNVDLAIDWTRFKAEDLELRARLVTLGASFRF